PRRFSGRPLASARGAGGDKRRRARAPPRRWRSPPSKWSGSSSHNASARVSEAIRHSRQFWNRPLVWNAKSEPKKCQAARAGRKAGLECFAWLSTLPTNLKKLSGTTSFKRLGGRMTDLMTNKSYVITTSLMRIGLLTAQIAMSPSAATQTMHANARQQPALRERETNCFGIRPHVEDVFRYLSDRRCRHSGP